MDLVVGASNNAVKSLVSKLGSLLAQEYTLIHGVRDDIQYITDELASMQAFLNRLKRASSNHNEQRLDWMKQVREVSYDIEDCVDDVDHRLSGEPRGSGTLRYLQKKWYLLTTLYARRCIATEISNLKTRAQHVSERRMRYGVKELDNNDDDGPGAAARRDRTPLPPQFVGTKEPVGIKEGMAKLQEWFDKGNKSQSSQGADVQSRYFAIAGSGGIGKTTLAMAFYHKIGFEIDRRACVLASQKFDLRVVLRSLIKQFREQKGDVSQNPVGRNEESDDLQELKSMLVDLLQGKRYMVLVDDIWSVSAWENIRDCLPKGGSIVVTTRFNSVAVACKRGQGDEIDKLKPLSAESSSSLFYEIISSVAECQELDDEEKDAMLKCTRRLPLAIVLVAGLVATEVKSAPKLEVDEPKPKIYDHLKKMEKALNAVLECNLPSEGVTEILDHCYKELPADLKTCLLYLSMFPKGCQISRKRLIRRWIAEGFIAEEQGNTVEEVADDCFNELIGRNLVRAVNYSSNGKLKSCQIHDMVLEYIVAKSNDENFITVVGGHWHTPFPSYKVRRLSVQRSDGKEKVERMKLSHVRSLTALGSLRALHSTLHKFQILKVLDLEGCTDLSSQQLKKICKMHQLKYLSLRRTDVEEIPAKIGRLESLEVLDIRETKITELPESVDKLQRMKHLLAGNKNMRHALKLTEGITKMTTLLTLSGVEISTDLATEILRDLQKLTNLRKFTIYKVSCTTTAATATAAAAATPSNFGSAAATAAAAAATPSNSGLLLSAIEHLSSCSLKYLAIDDDFTGFLDTSLIGSQAPPEHLHTLQLSGKLSRVPKWIVSLHNLEKLTLSLTSLTTVALRDLAKLPELFSLIFSLDSTKNNPTALKMLQRNTLRSGGMIFVPAKGFQKLKLLRFATPVVPPLCFLEGAMPVLQRIELRFRMVEGVYGLENLSKLQQVVLIVSSQAPDDAKEKVKELASIHGKCNTLSVVVDEYNESTDQK